MEHPIQQVSDWIESQKSRTLRISKGELSIGQNEVYDLDEVEIQLEKVSLGKLNHKDPDDYVASQTLLLHGHGKVQTAAGETRLPQDVYEIPLYGSWKLHKTDSGLQIRTERAIYSIRPSGLIQ